MWRRFIDRTVMSLVWAVLGTTPAWALSVVGTVRDAETLAPVEGYYVTLHAMDPDSFAVYAASGPDGAFALHGAPPGNQIYVLVGYGGGYVNYYARIPEPSPELTWEVLLDSLAVPDPGGDPPDSSVVSGQITTAGGEPIVEATVILTIENLSFSSWTSSDGRYSMTVPRGTYAGNVWADGFAPVGDSGIDAGLAATSYNVVLPPATAGVPPPAGATVAVRAILPNPLHRDGQVHYALTAAGQVELEVYDLAGRAVSRLVSEWRPAGAHVAALPTAHLGAGVYFCRLRVGHALAVRRFAVVR